MKYLPLTILGKTENSVFVRPNTQETIIELKVPKGHVAFLKLIEIDKYYPNTEYQLYIDGNYVMTYQREGKYEYDPPFVVKKSLRIVGVNYSSDTVPMGVFVDGIVVIIS